MSPDRYSWVTILFHICVPLRLIYCYWYWWYQWRLWNSDGDRSPINYIYGFLIFKLVAVTWRNDRALAQTAATWVKCANSSMNSGPYTFKLHDISQLHGISIYWGNSNIHYSWFAIANYSMIIMTMYLNMTYRILQLFYNCINWPKMQNLDGSLCQQV